MKVYDDGSKRGEDDGYRCPLVPGLRSSEDAVRLAEEIAFSSGRLLTLHSEPPGSYGQARALGQAGDLEGAIWTCFLIAYLSPSQGDDSFAGIRDVLAQAPELGMAERVELQEIGLGPRTSHEPARGTSTLAAYGRWVDQAGSQVDAFSGDPAWGSERRFERLFERLALPGLARWARYELLVLLSRLGLCDLSADGLHLGGGSARPGRPGSSAQDTAVVAAKRVFGIGDPLLLERRGLELGEACGVPVETLELALANWGVAERATLGFGNDCCDLEALERAKDALGGDRVAPDAERDVEHQS